MNQTVCENNTVEFAPVDLFVTVFVFRTDEFRNARGLEVGEVGDFEFLRVPFDRFAAFAGFRSGPNGEVAEEDRFGERTGEVREVAPAEFRFVFLNSGEPFKFVAGVEVAGVFVGRSFTPFDALDFFEGFAAFGAEFVTLSVVVRAVSATFGTDDDRAGVGRFRDAVFFEDRGFRFGFRVKPGNFDGVAPIVGRELEPNLAQRREGVEVVAGGFRDDFGREFQVASAVRHVGGVARHVAEGAGTEVPPTAPLEGVIDARPEFAFRRRTNPAVPIDVLESGFDLLFLFGDFVVGDIRIFFADLGGEFFHRHVAVRTLGPNRTVRPNVDGFDFADDAGFNLGDAVAHRVERATLVPHLGADAVFLGEVAEVTGFADRAGERLLGVSVFAGFQRLRGDAGVGVVRGADDDGVDLVHHFGVEIAVVGVALRLFEVFRLTFERSFIDIAERDDVAVDTGLLDVAGAFAADADTGDREALEGGSAGEFNGVAGANHETGARDRRNLKKIASGSLNAHVETPKSSK